MKRFICLLLLSLSLLQFSIEAKSSSSSSKEKYQYQVSAVLMFCDEAYFLKEWLEYHKLIGVEHFYLFNNGSTDNYLAILQPYLASGEVELYDYPEKATNQPDFVHLQTEVIYNHALSLARGKTKWLAIIDADEFIFPVKNKPLIKILDKYSDFGGVYVDFLYFGTAHVEKVPADRLIIEMLNRSQVKAKPFGKSIVRPDRVSHCTDPHRMWYNPPYVHVDTNYKTFDWTPEKASEDTLLLYHYYVGDIDHALNVTFERRKKWIGVTTETYLSDIEWMNERENNTMKRYIPLLRERMGL